MLPKTGDHLRSYTRHALTKRQPAKERSVKFPEAGDGNDRGRGMQ